MWLSIGYGSQGYGQSTNLKDSGVDVVIGVRPDGPSAKKAKAEGLKVMSIEDAVKWCGKMGGFDTNTYTG